MHYSVLSRAYNVRRTLLVVQCTWFILRRTMYVLQYSSYNVRRTCTSYYIRRRMYVVQYSSYNVRGLFYVVQCMFYNTRRTMYVIQCTSYNVRRTLQPLECDNNIILRGAHCLPSAPPTSYHLSASPHIYTRAHPFSSHYDYHYTPRNDYPGNRQGW